MKQENRLNTKGFTLVELLATVAIIAVLSTIVIVSMSGVSDKAKVASLQTTISSVATHASLCVGGGGDVQVPTSATTGGGSICDLLTVTAEVYPPLNVSGLENSNYQYITTNNVTVSAGVGTDPVVTCSVTSKSCAVN